MPQIPSVPTLEPVDKPMMKPSEAGRPGKALAGVGEDVQSMANSGMQLASHIREAQKHVDQLAAGNELNAAFEAYQGELANAKNSRDVNAITEKYTGPSGIFGSISKKWSDSGSPAAIEIGQQSQSLVPHAVNHGTLRQLTLMGQENKLQTDAQIDKLMPEYVGALRSGNPNAVGILAHMNSLYDDAVKNNLMGEEEAKNAKEKLRVDIQKQINEAAITSLNPSERKEAIRQAKDGGTGPMDLTGMTQAEKNLLHNSAVEMDKHLTEQGEAQNLNGALNIKHSDFDDPKNNVLYKNPDGSPNFEARMKALDSDDWYIKNGIVDENGKPDRVMGEKLMQDEVRLRGYSEKEQADRDEKGLAPLYSLIEDNKVTRPQLDQAINGMSARAKSMAISKWNQHQSENRAENRAQRQMSIEDRQLKAQDDAVKSRNAYWDIYGKIQTGGVVEPLDVLGNHDLNKADRGELLEALKTPNQYIQDGRNRIAELPLIDSSKAEMFRIFVNQAKQGNLQGAAITQSLEPLIKRAKESGANAWVEETFRTMNSRAEDKEKGVVRRDTMGPSPGTPEYDEMQKNQPKQKEQKQNPEEPKRPAGVPSSAVLTTNPKTGKKAWAW